MTILVTGATSAVGYFIAKEVALENKNANIRILIRSDKPPEHLEKLGFSFVKGDLTDKLSLEDALEDVEVVYHAAGEARENVSADLYYTVNQLGTKNILEAFVKQGGKKFLHVSTVGVFGYQAYKELIKEDYPKKGTHPYHISKWLAEQEVFRQANEHNFFASAVRPPYIVGPRDRQMAPKLFDFLINEKKIPLINGGKALLSFVHHRDVAQALIACSKEEKANGEAFNVAGSAAPVKEIFETVGQICNKEPNFLKIGFRAAYTLGIISEIIAKITKSKPKITRRRVHQFSITRTYDTSKLETVVGFKPKFGLKEMFEDAYSWMKEENLV
ncbi:MAG: NAD-dependent epimerase/dehydratase family protein [Candidatus Heimdallarchaeota archaeon]|nr:NAD-dependent epimerase/dehydratase family protein [Candidatus Heimdallarchaeota archaeon]